MLSKIQASVILAVGTAFAAFTIWGFVSPVELGLIETLVNVVFSILALIWPAKKLVEAVKYNLTSEKIQGLK